MKVEIEIIKGIPVKQIEKFEDKVIYNVAVLTREETKSLNAFPERTGTLKREEIALPILGSNKEYGLQAGVEYAHKVYKYENVQWTNKSTLSHWYDSVYNKSGDIIKNNAVDRALKEIK